MALYEELTLEDELRLVFRKNIQSETELIEKASKSMDGWFPIHRAVQLNCYKAVEWLYKVAKIDIHVVTTDGYPIHHVAQRIDMLLVLEKYGIDLNQINPYTHMTPLMMASRIGNLELIQFYYNLFGPEYAKLKDKRENDACVYAEMYGECLKYLNIDGPMEYKHKVNAILENTFSDYVPHVGCCILEYI